ncbi:hypothetical protein [Streptomyces chryseus]
MTGTHGADHLPPEITAEQRKQLLARVVSIGEAFAQFAAALQEALPMVERFEAGGRRARARPAWQSPYGPPQRRR